MKKIRKQSQKKDQLIESWDKQLTSLLNEGMTITTSTGQQGMGDSVSVNATDADAHNLIQLLQNAGLNTFGSDSSNSGQSQIDVEPMAQDEVMAQLSASDDSGEGDLSFLKRMIGARHDVSDHGDHSEICSDCECDPCECDSDEETEIETESDHEQVDEDEVEEGNEFTGARQRAIKAGKDTFRVGGKTYHVKGDTNDEKSQVEESHVEEEMCEQCGDTMSEEHSCASEKLDEWANSPADKSNDEEFQTEIDFMTRLISGGLNGMKQDQTTLPHTRVKSELSEAGDVATMMKRLAGIRK